MYAAPQRSTQRPGRTVVRLRNESMIELDESFESFYERAYPDLVRALVFTLNDVELGTEAVDEAMARAYSRWAQVVGYGNPTGWVYRVALNWARSAHRRLARRLRIVGREPVLEPELTDPAVAEAMASLTFDLRAVVVCRLWADLSVETTAEILGLKPGTVKSRLHRALFILRSTLSAHDPTGSRIQERR